MLYGLKQSPREWNTTVNNFMVGECSFVSQDEYEPNNIKKVYARPHRQQAREQFNSKWDMVYKFAVMSELFPLPDWIEALNCQFIYKRKRGHQGNGVKYKPRLTFQGYSQQFGVDFSDTYSQVVLTTTLCFVLALECLLSLQTTSLVITNSFLNAPLHIKVYINTPP